MASNIDPNLSIKLAALIAALAAFTIEDFVAIKAEQLLGDNIADNIAKLQADAGKIDDETLAAWAAARSADGLNP